MNPDARMSQTRLTEQMLETTKAVLDAARSGYPLLVRSKAADEDRFTRYQRLESAQNLDRLVGVSVLDGTMGVADEGRILALIADGRDYEVALLGEAAAVSLDRSSEEIANGNITGALEWAEEAWYQSLPSIPVYDDIPLPEIGETDTFSMIPEQPVYRSAFKTEDGDWRVRGDGSFSDEEFHTLYTPSDTPGCYQRQSGFAQVRELLHPGAYWREDGERIAFVPGDVLVLPSFDNSTAHFRVMGRNEFMSEFKLDDIQFDSTGKLTGYTQLDGASVTPQEEPMVEVAIMPETGTAAEVPQQKPFRPSIDIDFGTPEFEDAVNNSDDFEF